MRDNGETVASLLEYAQLLVDYDAVQRENKALNEQYIMVELENFEISSYYEQILAEEKEKIAPRVTKVHQGTSPMCTMDESSPSMSPLLPAIPDDD